jgi:hypothetical protein
VYWRGDSLRTGGITARGVDPADPEGAGDRHAGLVIGCGLGLAAGRERNSCGEVVMRDRELPAVGVGVLRRISVGA